MKFKKIKNALCFHEEDIGKLSLLLSREELKSYKINKDNYISIGVNDLTFYYVVIEKVITCINSDENYNEFENDEYAISVYNYRGKIEFETIKEAEKFLNGYKLFDIYDDYIFSAYENVIKQFYSKRNDYRYFEQYYRKILTHKILSKYIKFYPQYSVDVLRAGMKQSMYFKVDEKYIKLSNSENSVVLGFPKDIEDNELLASNKAEYHPRYELAYEIQEIKNELKKFLNEVNTLFVHYKVREYHDIIKIITESSTYFKEYEHLTVKPHFLKIAFEEVTKSVILLN